MATNLITVQEFTSYAPEIDLGRYTTPTVSGFIAMATRQVIDYLEYDPNYSVVVNEKVKGIIGTNGDLIFRPKKVPLVEVDALSITKGTVEASIQLTTGDAVKYDIDPNGLYARISMYELVMLGYPVFSNFYALKGTQFYLKGSYKAGYIPSEMPETIKYATSLFARDILGRSTNTTGAKSITQGGITISYSERDGKSDLVKDAERLLVTYRLI